MSSGSLGLSCTAVGLRPLDDVLRIADDLREPLGLEFLELAIGVSCHVDANYGAWPLLLHDSCLVAGPTRQSLRYRFDILDRKTWATYKTFVDNHHVLALSAHAPLRSRATDAQVRDAVSECTDLLGIPVMLEVMPEPQRWCSSLETLIDVPLVVDVSHVHIWSRGDDSVSLRLTESIMSNHCVAGLHLSHNDGRHDSHELIPEDVWFSDAVDRWVHGRIVTLESLPTSFAKYERLDRRSRWSRAKFASAQSVLSS